MRVPNERLLRALVVGTLLALGQGGPASAASPTVPPPPSGLREPTGNEMLSVTPSLIGVEIKPGATATAELNLRAAAALNVTVTVGGLGQQPDGSFGSLTADKDTSPYSARAMISAVPQAFTMQPGGSQKVTVTMSVPANVGSGTRYALVSVTGLPKAGSQNVGFGVALSAPVLITVGGTKPTLTGVISDLTIGKSLPGQPLPVTATLKNTGDAHFGNPPLVLTESTTLQDSKGNLVGKAILTLTGNSIIPTFARQLLLPLGLSKPLVDGRYHLEVGAGLQDGTVLDRRAIDFDWSGGAVLGATGAPAQSVASAGASSDSGLLVIVIGLLLVVVGLMAALILVLGRRRRRPAGEAPAR